ncbi:MAG: hypothetical protein MI717_00150, partial [Spirochaetales bacterium]|nr:hypothetical protein [Spirochaetales bacterium]
DRNSMHYYGYNTDVLDTTLEKGDISQNFITVGAVTGMKTTYTDSAHLNYDATLNYRLFMDKAEYMENYGGIKGFASYFYGKEQLGLDADIGYYNRILEDTVNNIVIKLEPWVCLFGKKWRVVAGLNMHTNAVNQDIFYHWYPNASLQYNIVDNILIPYVTVNGNLEVNSYHKIAMENPFIKPGLQVDNTNNKLVIGAGIRGNLSSNTSYNFSGQFSQIDNMYLFVRDTSDVLENQFVVECADYAENYKFSGEIAYKRSAKLSVLLKGNYYIYNLNNVAKAWHMPDYDATISARYNLRSKILVNADFFLIGKRYAKSFDPAVEYTELKEIIDLNLGVEYRYNKVLSAFVNFNNIAATKY